MAAQPPEQSGNTVNDASRGSESAPSAIWTEFFRLEQRRIAAQSEQDSSRANDPQTYPVVHVRDYGLVRVGLLLLSGVFMALFALVLLMAFFGDPRQSALALRILTVGGQAVGGGGFLLLVAVAYKRLFER